MKKLRAYTLAEIVVTMVIMAIVAGISIKISRAKLDNIITYTYYTAYSTVKTAVSQMLVDFSVKEYTGVNQTPGGTCTDTPPTTDHIICSTDNEWVCEAGYQLNADQNACISMPRTVPRAGVRTNTMDDKQVTFCEKFIEYLNTNDNSANLTKSGSNYVECKGAAITSSITNFSNVKADFVLRNGMRVYNAGQNPAEISALQNIAGTDSYAGITDNYDSVTNTNLYGYTLYIDIDGSTGPSTLWQDVYPIYVTVSGKVIPAYRAADGAGGNDRKYLQTSVALLNGASQPTWKTKSVAFKESACISGYIPSNATGAKCSYCGSIEVDSDCNAEGSECRMQIIKPIKGL